MSGPATSGASLEGHPLLGGTTVLQNEVVTTGPGGTAILARDQGGMVTLGHSTQASVGDSSSAGATLNLQTGLATVYGAAPVITPQGSLNPGGPNTCYQVVVDGDKTYILGVSGTTQVEGGNSTFNVGPNQAYVLQNGPNGQLIATAVPAGTVQNLVQGLEGNTVTQVQTASPVR